MLSFASPILTPLANTSISVMASIAPLPSTITFTDLLPVPKSSTFSVGLVIEMNASS